VSLRRDIHTAYDVITPDTGGMAERVVETARRQAPALPRRRKFMFGMRAPLPLLAVLLAVAIVAAVLVGGRVWWNTTHGVSPAGGVTLPTLAELEARPWQHQLLAPAEQCAGEQLIGSHIGNGPIKSYPISLTAYGDREYSTGENVIDRGFSGLLIVRLRDARTGQNHVFISQNAGGPVVGTDTVDGKVVEQHTEAVFDLSDPKVTAASNGTKTFTIREGHRLPVSGCFQWQYDGTYQGKPYVWSWYFSG
jgi:hypothetical protein